jgi:hypothetical protein
MVRSRNKLSLLRLIATIFHLHPFDAFTVIDLGVLMVIRISNKVKLSLNSQNLLKNQEPRSVDTAGFLADLIWVGGTPITPGLEYPGRLAKGIVCHQERDNRLGSRMPESK